MELAIYLLGIMCGVFATVAAANAFQLRRGGATSGSPACRAGCRAVRQTAGGRSPGRRRRPLRGHVQLLDLAGLNGCAALLQRVASPEATSPAPARVKLAGDDDRSEPGDPAGTGG